MCEHKEFEVHAEVVPASSDRVRGTTGWFLVAQARCAECKTRFAFQGCRIAGMTEGPTSSISGFELVAPVVPDGHMTSLMASVGAPWEARR